MINLTDRKYRYGIIAVFVALIVFGVFARFYRITANEFVYYDEGLYLAHNVDFMYYMDARPPQNFLETFKYLNICFHMALTDAKALWFFLANLRAFFFSSGALFFTRLLSAIFGCLTLIPMYFLTRRFCGSKWAGWLGVVLLAILPSHIYYSRLGMQEALSTLCVLSGIYWYVYPRKIHWKTFVSAAFLSAAFFSNYRLIILPALIFFTEIFLSLAEKKRPDFRKFIYHLLAFAAAVVLVGNLDHGANTRITFAWMFHQADLAQGQFAWVNVLSYPYYIFRLESLVFGVLFFGNVYFIFRRDWRRLWPFGLVCLQMAMFSLPQEKAVRYLCVVMPLMVLAVVSLVDELYREERAKRWPGVALLSVMCFWQVGSDVTIMNFRTDYNTVVKDVISQQRPVGLISSQPLIHQLLLANKGKVVPPSGELPYYAALYQKGFQYVALDPQAYVSYTQDGTRFSPRLDGFLNFIDKAVPPDKVYSHFSPALLERFVLEHNVSLPQSLAFLKANRESGGMYGRLRLYHLGKVLYVAQQHMKEAGSN